MERRCSACSATAAGCRWPRPRSRSRVSEATIRRDFAALADQQLATRTHGGVVATGMAYDLPARYRGRSDPDRGPAERKERIAAAAAALLEPGTVVGFNGGTTTTATARRLAARPDLQRADLRRDQARPAAITVVTNALNIATEMVLRPHVRTVTLGGIARPAVLRAGRPAGRAGPRGALAGRAGAGGRRVRRGRPARPAGTGVRPGSTRTWCAGPGRVMVVAGSEKLGRRTFARICPAAGVHTLVTDTDAPVRAASPRSRAAGVQVHRA